MNVEKLNKALEMAVKMRHIFVATADKIGQPHIAAAGSLTLTASGAVGVSSWFCPETVSNVGENKYISLVVWDSNKDIGFQLVGRVEDIQDLGILDGITPQIEMKKLFPQVKRQLLVRVEKVIEFTHAPHSDVEA